MVRKKDEEEKDEEESGQGCEWFGAGDPTTPDAAFEDEPALTTVLWRARQRSSLSTRIEERSPSLNFESAASSAEESGSFVGSRSRILEKRSGGVQASCLSVRKPSRSKRRCALLLIPSSFSLSRRAGDTSLPVARSSSAFEAMLTRSFRMRYPSEGKGRAEMESVKVS